MGTCLEIWIWINLYFLNLGIIRKLASFWISPARRNEKTIELSMTSHLFIEETIKTCFSSSELPLGKAYSQPTKLNTVQIILTLIFEQKCWYEFFFYFWNCFKKLTKIFSIKFSKILKKISKKKFKLFFHKADISNNVFLMEFSRVKYIFFFNKITFLL